MRSFLLVIGYLFAHYTFGQSTLTGKITDAVTKKPIGNVSIFLSHTTIGTVSNENGEFAIANMPQGKFQLIASSLNYENYITTVEYARKGDPLSIVMIPTQHTLQEVIVEPYDKDGWKNWGGYFITHFIGNFSLIKNCRLLNPDAVKFRFNNKKNTLRAFAHEKLIFENKSLGYRIQYLLTRFELDFTDNTFKYVGYPLFENMVPKNLSEKKKWDSARVNIYRGSLRHFLRSIYNNQLIKEGFEVRAIKIVSTEEKARVNEINKVYDQMQEAGLKPRLRIQRDSLDYYQKIKVLPDSNNKIILNKLLLRDSLVLISKGGNEATETIVMQFPGGLHISYLHKSMPYDYTNTQFKISDKDVISCQIELLFGKGVSIYKNGNYFNGENLIIEGYWSWSEKLSTMLPSDYWPETKNN